MPKGGTKTGRSGIIAGAQDIASRLRAVLGHRGLFAPSEPPMAPRQRRGPVEDGNEVMDI